MPMKYATHLINSPLKIHHTEPTVLLLSPMGWSTSVFPWCVRVNFLCSVNCSDCVSELNSFLQEDKGQRETFTR